MIIFNRLLFQGLQAAMSNNSSISANGAQVKIRRIFQNVKTRNNFQKFVRTHC